LLIAPTNLPHLKSDALSPEKIVYTTVTIQLSDTAEGGQNKNKTSPVVFNNAPHEHSM